MGWEFRVENLVGQTDSDDTDAEQLPQAEFPRSPNRSGRSPHPPENGKSVETSSIMRFGNSGSERDCGLSFKCRCASA
ncbi:unnamed protein product [Tuwongella immobilis]|uniref:Uncharacterized protein n=1 Tax=Tuwongella immobilis TaxID=692036 RepID=A0A6C2YLM7_9BACT|nr:unnamed protein product [Tuwongella immobilis]VTS01520.1 unnamed protein product [Tuwongella immobilis]